MICFLINLHNQTHLGLFIAPNTSFSTQHLDLKGAVSHKEASKPVVLANRELLFPLSGLMQKYIFALKVSEEGKSGIVLINFVLVP